MRSLLALIAIWAASIIPAVAEPETSTSTLEERLAEIRRSPPNAQAQEAILGKLADVKARYAAAKGNDLLRDDIAKEGIAALCALAKNVTAAIGWTGTLERVEGDRSSPAQRPDGTIKVDENRPRQARRRRVLADCAAHLGCVSRRRIEAEIVMDVDAPPIIPDQDAQGHGASGSSRRNP